MNPDANIGLMLANAMQAQASRPQKTSTMTTRESTSEPVEYRDMLNRRNMIGVASANLAKSLAAREGRGYNFANALSNVAGPQSEGTGLGLTNLARAFGGAYKGRIDANIANQEKMLEASRADLADALNYNKAMGTKETQTENQVLGYDGAGPGGRMTAPGGMSKDQATFEVANENLGDLWQTINENPFTFSAVGGVNQGQEARALREGIRQKGVETLGRNEFSYLQSIMPKGFATAINTAAEQAMMRPYTTAFAEGTGTAKKAAIKNMMGTVYDAYEREAKQQGFQMPMSREQYINSRIGAGRELNPEYYSGSSTEMYKSNQPADTAGYQPGQIVDGYRFKGGNPADQNNWEQAQ